MTITTLGIDIAKNVFQLHGTNAHGKMLLSKRVSRATIARMVQQLPPCLIAMEACGGAHYWARKFTAMGHLVKLISCNVLQSSAQNPAIINHFCPTIIDSIKRARLTLSDSINCVSHNK